MAQKITKLHIKVTTDITYVWVKDGAIPLKAEWKEESNLLLFIAENLDTKNMSQIAISFVKTDDIVPLLLLDGYVESFKDNHLFVTNPLKYPKY